MEIQSTTKFYKSAHNNKISTEYVLNVICEICVDSTVCRKRERAKEHNMAYREKTFLKHKHVEYNILYFNMVTIKT